MLSKANNDTLLSDNQGKLREKLQQLLAVLMAEKLKTALQKCF